MTHNQPDNPHPNAQHGNPQPDNSESPDNASLESRPWTAQRYLVIDVEGNGGQPPDLVELAIVPIDGGVIGPVQEWLVRPVAPITGIARRIHGISNTDVATAPAFASIHDQVTSCLVDGVVVGHNVRVDLSVLRRKLPDWQPAAVLDTLRLARSLLPDLPTHRLGALTTHLDLAAGLPNGLRPHRAGYDALLTARLLAHLASNTDGTTSTIRQLHHLGAIPYLATTPATNPEPEQQTPLF